MKRLFSLLTMILLFLPACHNQTVEPMLRVGTNQWPGYELFYLAKHLGKYNAREVRLVELPSATEVMQLLRSGRIDAAALTLDEVLSAVEQGVDIKIVLGVDFSNGADVLLTKPEISSINDLKGKKVAVEATAVGAILLNGALDSSNLKLSDLQIIPTTVNHHYHTFTSGKVDAVVTFEPVRTKLLSVGAHQLFSSKDIPKQIVDVLVIRRDAMRSSPRAVQQLIDGYFSALSYLEKNPDDAVQLMAPRLGVSPKAMLVSYDTLEMLDRDDNNKLFAAESAEFKSLTERIGYIMTKHQLLQHKVQINNLFAADFMQ
ncbi:MAG: ABC transporter substrate-binding protein [Mariprofundus sp.]|nr:ABC transporter substrate-binding protein [Mariprofundus sp.]